jgi:hypothetical protein
VCVGVTSDGGVSIQTSPGGDGTNGNFGSSSNLCTNVKRRPLLRKSSTYTMMLGSRNGGGWLSGVLGGDGGISTQYMSHPLIVKKKKKKGYRQEERLMIRNRYRNHRSLVEVEHLAQHRLESMQTNIGFESIR